MSTAKPASKTRGAPKKKVTKVPVNLSMTPEIAKRAKKAAFSQGLSLSGWIEQMVRAKMETEAAQ